MNIEALIETWSDCPSMAFQLENRSISYAELQQQLIAWAHLGKNYEEKVWGLHIEETWNFAYVFFGLLLAGKEIRILPSAQHGLLEDLTPSVDAFVLDKNIATLDAVQIQPSEMPTLDSSIERTAISTHTFSFFTSGSTGEGKMFPKEIDHLLAEVEILNAAWGDRAFGVCATVSHQHIYGFLFKLLWPLVTRRTIWSSACFYPADIEDAFKHLGSGYLISTPSHLKRLPDLMNWDAIAGRCTRIFSSGGPLALESALAIEECAGFAPIEVFGSTETGGVAWRQQSTGNTHTPWQPFDGVHVSRHSSTGCLLVASPFIHPSEVSDGMYATKDAVELLGDGQFTLKGRVDRIVKVEQKRVSLEHMEQCLVSLDEVDDASIVVLNDGAGLSRSRLGAAITLSEAGQAFKGHLKKHLKQSLSQWFEPTVLPRSWVFVQALPVNAQGKKPLADLRALFKSSEQTDVVMLPVIYTESKAHHEVLLDCEVPEDMLYFDGHFDTLPVVAGVVQIHWAMQFSEKYFGIETHAHQLEAIKFHQLLFPRDRFTLKLSYNKDSKKVQFAIFANDKKFSSGRVAVGAV